MPLKIQCPVCKKVATVPDSAAGKSARCGCGSVISIPVVESASEELTLQPTENTEPPPEPTISQSQPQPRRTSKGKLNGESDDAQSKREPTRQKAVRIVGTVVALILLIVLYSNSTGHSSTGMPSHSDAAPESGKTASVEVERRRSAALDDTLHEFQRTDAAEWIERDHFRAVIYVVIKTVPEKRQKEVLNDLLLISKLAPNAWNYIREPRSEVARDYAALKTAPLISQAWGKVDDIFVNLDFETPAFANLSKGPKDSFEQFVTGYMRMAKDCSTRGTTVEAEAKKALGE